MRRFAQAVHVAGVAAFAVGYLAAWAQLPATIPIRFTADGAAAASLTRGLYLLLALTLITSTGVIWWRIRRHKNGDAIDLGWLILALGELGLLAAVPVYAATGDTRWLTAVLACGAALGATAVVIAAVSVARATGTFRAPELSFFAEEQHRAPRRAAWNSIFLLAPLLVIALVPGFAARLIAGAGLGLGIWAIALLWSGFRYRFGAKGIEVLALGGRAQFVSRDEIVGCERRTIDPLRNYGGWGIRGSRERRAFVLGGRDGVAVITRSGEMFLAHPDPDRLIHHIERVREGATR